MTFRRNIVGFLLLFWIDPMLSFQVRKQLPQLFIRHTRKSISTLVPSWSRISLDHRRLNDVISSVRSIALFSSETDIKASINMNDISSNPATSPSSQSVKSPELELLEIRVGTIVEIEKHPEADSLYVEKVDVGEASGPRTIVSGLVNYCSPESLLHRKVVVLCNLKPRPFKGIPSHGMLLCASNADKTKVEPLTPAASCPNGELIQFSDHVMSPIEASNRASKAFSKIGEDFFVNDHLQATFRDIPFMTSAGPIITTLKGKIS